VRLRGTDLDRGCAVKSVSVVFHNQAHWAVKAL
jgi:hypothetical protein